MSSLGPPSINKRRQQPYSQTLVSNEKLQFQKNTLIPYKHDLLQYYQFLNNANLPDPSMLDIQPEINDSFTNSKMRSTHLDFLINLHSFLQLKQETLYLSINIHDRYCCKRIVYKKHYLLVLLTSLWIASKYLDKKNRIPNLKELCYYANTCKINKQNDELLINYDNSMFIQMEQHICTTLEWEIGTGISQEEILQMIFMNISQQNKKENILQNNINNSQEILKIYQISSFLCEYSFYHKNFMFFNKNIISCVSVLLASKIYNLDSSKNHNWLCIDSTLEDFEIDGISIDPFFNVETDLNELRKCCHCFLNELFNIYNNNNDNNNTEDLKGKILFKKYKLINIMDLLIAFIENNYNAYIKLGYLSEQIINYNNNNNNNKEEEEEEEEEEDLYLKNNLNLQIINISDYFLNIPQSIYETEKWSTNAQMEMEQLQQQLYNTRYQEHDQSMYNEMDIDEAASYYTHNGEITNITNDSPNNHSATSSTSTFDSPTCHAIMASGGDGNGKFSSMQHKAQTPITPMSTVFMKSTQEQQQQQHSHFHQ